MSGKPRPRALTLRFGLPPRAARRDAAPFREAVLRATGIALEIVPMPSYAALFEAVDRGACDAAWAPPLVALDLVRCGTASPLVALERGRAASVYHAVLLAREAGGAPHVADLAGARVGWVAPESASAYVVPRLQLAALGFAPTRLFAAEVFLG